MNTIPYVYMYVYPLGVQGKMSEHLRKAETLLDVITMVQAGRNTSGRVDVFLFSVRKR